MKKIKSWDEVKVGDILKIVVVFASEEVYLGKVIKKLKNGKVRMRYWQVEGEIFSGGITESDFSANWHGDGGNSWGMFKINKRELGEINNKLLVREL